MTDYHNLTASERANFWRHMELRDTADPELVRWRMRQGALRDWSDKNADASPSGLGQPSRKRTDESLAGSNPAASAKEIQELRAQVNYLQNKIMELRVEKKKKDDSDFVPF